MTAVVADTHALIWRLLDPVKLSSAARTALNDAVSGGYPIYVATVTLVELQYLVEKGRFPVLVLDQVEANLDMAGSPYQAVSLDAAIARALRSIPRANIPDMPDRIIAATALHLNLPLVSRDRKIQAAAIQTIW